MRPAWSICAWESMSASISSVLRGKNLFASSDSFRRPWNMPQSRRNVLPLTRRTCFEPVTVCAAPTNSSCIRRVLKLTLPWYQMMNQVAKIFRRLLIFLQEKWTFYDNFLQNWHFSAPFMRFFLVQFALFLGKFSTVVITPPVRLFARNTFSRSSYKPSRLSSESRFQ